MPLVGLLPGSVVWYPAWDELLFRALNFGGTNPVLDALVNVGAKLGYAQVLALLAIPLWWIGRRELAFNLLPILVIVEVVTTVLKFAFDRARPCDVLSDVHTLVPNACALEPDPSFPSGHASRVFAVAMLLALYFKWPVKVSAFLFAAAIGVSRVYMGIHWPSDVIAGAALGIALAFAYEAVAKRSNVYQKTRARILDGITRLLSRKRAKAA